MIIAYLPVRDLIAQLNDRDMFTGAIKDEEIHELVNAAERLIGRARQELNVRLTAEFGDQP